MADLPPEMGCIPMIRLMKEIYMAANSYENAGTIPLGMTSEQAAKRRAERAKSQHPFAIILSCSDSRVPPEIASNPASQLQIF